MRIAAAAELHSIKWDQIESGGPGSGRHPGFGTGMHRGYGSGMGRTFTDQMHPHLQKGGWQYKGRSGEGSSESRSYSHPDHGNIHTHGDGSWMHSPKGGKNTFSGRGPESLHQHVAKIDDFMAPSEKSQTAPSKKIDDFMSPATGGKMGRNMKIDDFMR